MPPESELVLLSGRRAEQAVHLDVLRNWSALGLIADFIWVDLDAPQELKGSPCISVTRGAMRAGLLGEDLARRSIVRTAHVVSISHMGETFSTVGERRGLELRHEVEDALPGAAVTSLHVVGVALHREFKPAEATELVWQGAHNLVLAPENAQSPVAGTMGIVGEAGSVTHTHLAAGVCSAVGLWTADRHTPFHGAPEVAGDSLVALRTYTRHLDADTVEVSLAAQLMDVEHGYPVPIRDGVPVQRHGDQTRAAVSMADRLLTKHADVLARRRPTEVAAPFQKVSFWSALRMMLVFLWRAITDAPKSFMDSLLRTTSQALASATQALTFGNDSAYVVTVRGIRGIKSSGEIVSADELDNDIGELIGDLQGMSAGAPPEHRDHTELWTDFVDGALTLLDGEKRSVGLEPELVGSGPGVVTDAATVVPSPAAGFPLASGVAGYTKVDRVAACDLDGASRADRLLEAQALEHAHLSTQLTIERGRLSEWAGEQKATYAGHVSDRLHRELEETRREIVKLADEWKSLAAEGDRRADVEREQGRIAQTLFRLTGGFLAGSGLVLLVLTILDRRGWVEAVGSLSVLWLIWLFVAAIVFQRRQRKLFQLLHQREAAASRIDAIKRDLPEALTNLRSLQRTYRQLMDWVRALGTFVNAPWGESDLGAGRQPALVAGYALNHRFGLAEVDSDAAESASGQLRHQLFPLGWTSHPWKAFVSDLPAIGSDMHFLQDNPDLIYSDRTVSTESILTQWSAAVAARRWVGGYSQLISRLREALAGDVGDYRTTLLGKVQALDLDGRPVTESHAEFMAELDAEPLAGRFSRRGLFRDVLESDQPWRIRDAHVTNTDQRFNSSLVLTQLTGGFSPRDLAFTVVGQGPHHESSRRTDAGPAPGV